MRKLAFAVLFIMLAAIKYVSGEMLTEDSIVQDILFPAGSSLQYDNGGALIIAVPSNDIEIQGIVCGKGGTITFYETGQLKFASLRKEQEIQGILCANNYNGVCYDGKGVSLYSSGRIRRAILAKDQVINGMRFLKNCEIAFDESGKVEEAVQGKPLEYGKITFGNDDKIFFDGDGNPCRVVLGNDEVIGGNKYPKRTEVCLDKEGKITQVMLSIDQEIQGILCAAPSKIYFYESGKIKVVEFIRAQEINGIWQKDNSRLELYESGIPRTMVLDRRQVIQGDSYDKGTLIRFYDTGKPKLIVLEEDKVIRDLPCAKGSIPFYESGNIKSMILSDDHIIGGIPCKKGSSVLFFKSGKLQSATISKDIAIQDESFKEGMTVVFDESGMLDRDVVNVQKGRGEYDFAEICYFDPKFVGNDKIVYLAEVNESRMAGYGMSSVKMAIIEKNIENAKEDVLYTIDCSDDKTVKTIAYIDKKNFQTSAESGVAFVEPGYHIDTPESMNIIRVDLKRKILSLVPRQGVDYRISPEGHAVIFIGKGTDINDIYKAKTIYMGIVDGQVAEALYESDDEILDICWIKKNIIAVLCVNRKEDQYIDIIDISKRELTGTIEGSQEVVEFISDHFGESISDDGRLGTREKGGDIILTDMKTEESRVIKKGLRWPK